MSLPPTVDQLVALESAGKLDEEGRSSSRPRERSSRLLTLPSSSSRLPVSRQISSSPPVTR